MTGRFFQIRKMQTHGRILSLPHHSKDFLLVQIEFLLFRNGIFNEGSVKQTVFFPIQNFECYCKYKQHAATALSIRKLI